MPGQGAQPESSRSQGKPASTAPAAGRPVPSRSVAGTSSGRCPDCRAEIWPDPWNDAGPPDPAFCACDRRFRETCEDAAIGLAHAALDGGCRWANRRFCEIVGLSHDRLMRTSFQGLAFAFGPRELDLPRLLTGAIPACESEVKSFREDGSASWFKLSISLVRDRLGRPRHLLGVAEDIGERKRAEDLLRSAQERLRLAQRASQSGLWDWDTASGSIYATPEYREVYGIAAGTVLDFAGWLESVHPEDRQATSAQIREILDGRANWPVEFRIVHPTRGMRWLAGFGGVTGGPAAHPTRISGITVDITERKLAEQELSRQRQEFEALAENSPDLIARIDTRLRHVYINRTLEKTIGIPRDQVLGRTGQELGMPPDLNASCDRLILAAIATRREMSLEFELHGPAGRRCYHGRFVPEIGPDDRVISVLSVAADITERKAQQEELLRIAEQEQRRIGQDLHDDVGQELTGVSLMVEVLAEALEQAGSSESGLAAKVRDRLGQIHRRVQDWARGLVPVEVGAHGLAGALEQLTSRIALHRGIDCNFECPRPLPIDDNRTATQLYRIAQEALSNALRHGNPSRVLVRLAAEGDDGAIRLEIRDDGTGIPEIPLRGEGMGLRIMRYRAGIIGASLAIEPAPDRAGGTRVVCTLAGGNSHDRSSSAGGGSGPDPDRR